jgi:hypothetical protein
MGLDASIANSPVNQCWECRCWQEVGHMKK